MALFGQIDWKFRRKEASMDTTAGTVEYQLSSSDYIGVAIDKVVSIRKTGSLQTLGPITVAGEVQFDALFPDPSVLTSGEPTCCKIHKKNGGVWMTLNCPPQQAYTLKILYLSEWSDDFKDIPKKLMPTLMAACLLQYTGFDEAKKSQAMAHYDKYLEMAHASDEIVNVQRLQMVPDANAYSAWHPALWALGYYDEY